MNPFFFGFDHKLFIYISNITVFNIPNSWWLFFKFVLNFDHIPTICYSEFDSQIRFTILQPWICICVVCIFCIWCNKRCWESWNLKFSVKKWLLSLCYFSTWIWRFEVFLFFIFLCWVLCLHFSVILLQFVVRV